ncbi:MAG: hypothetical protein L0H10_15030 [Comamonas sp.]|uniref:hypothetical protein n=1 Tax=Comamonas TaxID=283 RepID=UPI0026482053|nr:hypothetical protein [Comamonas sp.]MDN5505107.1 hypothetical protein [Comamonas sp.]MDN5539358.1 hypothetical protein [Comamonas sp.]
MPSAPGFCDCSPPSAPDGDRSQDLPRRQLLAAALLGGLGAWSLPAAACGPEVAAPAAPSNVCLECLARRAQQRSAFVNKELP